LVSEDLAPDNDNIQALLRTTMSDAPATLEFYNQNGTPTTRSFSTFVKQTYAE